MINRNLALLFIFSLLLGIHIPAIALTVSTVDQGSAWTDNQRNDFYRWDQGSQLIPYAWAKELLQEDGKKAFFRENLSRYGYLPNPKSNPSGLPIGFHVNTQTGQVGMTCAACHTRQIEYNGKAYRLDGGPAITDFGAFLMDLDKSVARLISDKNRFDAFATKILGANPSISSKDNLLSQVKTWQMAHHTLISRALPTNLWGAGRLDAVSMIFNRLAGLDIGDKTNNYIIPENIYPANAPVRYPFVWNAPKQDKTQWPGFADNGDDFFGLLRNQGEVFGVFGKFHPVRENIFGVDFGVNYSKQNSTNFNGLNKLESLVKTIGPPKWPFGTIDANLASQGKVLFEANCSTNCHEQKDGTPRGLFGEIKTWNTPVQDVGTDSHQYDILLRTVKTGVLEGEEIPFRYKLSATDKPLQVLEQAVFGSIMESNWFLNILGKGASVIDQLFADIGGAFRTPSVDVSAPSYPYETRVLQGIWAAAPYLHNGSVPTLADLLKPASERPTSFEVGNAYDPVKVGLAASQPQFSNQKMTTTDCNSRNTGNSRCGHEFGTQLTDQEKSALLEYMKGL